MIPLYLFCGENAFPIHQLNRTFTNLLDAVQYCVSSSGLPASIKFGKKSGCRRRAMQTGPLLRRGFVRRRRPVIKGLSSEESPAIGGAHLNPVLSSGETPLTGGRQSLCAPNIKRHSAKSAFLYNHSDSFSPSDLPFRGSGRSRRFPAAAPSRRS